MAQDFIQLSESEIINKKYIKHIYIDKLEEQFVFTEDKSIHYLVKIELTDDRIIVLGPMKLNEAQQRIKAIAIILTSPIR